jgi:hypothetical protein
MIADEEGGWLLNAGIAGDGGADEYTMRGGFDE